MRLKQCMIIVASVATVYNRHRRYSERCSRRALSITNQRARGAGGKALISDL